MIERPLSDELDISGWESAQGVAPDAQTQPALLEVSLGSPLGVLEEPGVREELLWLGNAFHSVPGSRHHYLSMVRGELPRLPEGDSGRLKKYLYVLRPLFAVRWLDLDLPPVALERIVEAITGRPSLREELDALLSLKRCCARITYIPPRLALQRFIEAELLRAERGAAQPTARRQDSRLLDRYLHDKIWQYTRKPQRERTSSNSTAAKAAGRSRVAP
ncbi:nucleotidyltransferase domain-containing protein [Pseudomonas aeruginosa]|nr:nucleotidyltransferase domain-containing protein [Pseudomonas aeruginosa]